MPSSPLWRRFYIAVIALAVTSGVWLALTNAAAPAADRSTDSTTKTESPLATVGVWEERLAVFAPQAATPDTVYEVFIASLPPAEQDALRAGIPVYTEAELQRLLEDYTG